MPWERIALKKDIDMIRGAGVTLLPTYTAFAMGVTHAAGKHLISLFNGAGSGKIVKVYRIWRFNNQLVPITGTLFETRIFRTTAQSAGTPIVPAKMDTADPDLPPQIVVATGATATTTILLSRNISSCDEPAAGSVMTLDEAATLWQQAMVWNIITNKPLTLREGEGVTLQQVTATTVGLSDILIEFTVE